MLRRVSFVLLFTGLLSVSLLCGGRSAADDRDANRTEAARSEGVHIMKEVAAVYMRMQTLTADFAVHQEVSGAPAMEMSGTVKAKKPDLYAIDSSGALPARMNSDGKTVLFYIKSENAYAQLPAGGQSMNLTVTSVAPLTLFFNPRKLVAPGTPTFYVGKERWHDKVYDCVEQRFGPSVMRYYVGADRVVYRLKVHLEMGGKKQDVEATLSHVRTNPSLSLADFPTLPPANARLFDLPVPGSKALAPGEQAPEFTLPQPAGADLALADLRKGRKAVLVTFWFTACATCRAEHPRLQKLYSELKDRGLEVVAVNSFDDHATIDRYVRQAGLSFPICMDDDGTRHFGIAQKYGVGVYPTSYLLDQSGKIVLRSVGFNEMELRAALEKLDVK
jgi:peroxiredoxin/outer membrane lipoprotein-sorting protein